MTLFASVGFLFKVWTLALASERAVGVWIFQTHPETGLAEVE